MTVALRRDARRTNATFGWRFRWAGRAGPPARITASRRPRVPRRTAAAPAADSAS
ncbi:hypothetical protein L810_3542 [Burkholderia sp. AU4i]|nr:hypothetical protein L810_3542 [Burkholderia sp. AU4i]